MNRSRQIFLAISLDTFLIVLFYSIAHNQNFKSYPNPIITFSIVLFYIVFSYVLDRYTISKAINLKVLLRDMVSSTTIFISANLVFFFINFFNSFISLIIQENFKINYQREQSIFFIKVTLLITLLSFFIQYCLTIFLNKIQENNNLWIFYGSQKRFKAFTNELLIEKTNYNVKRITNKTKLSTFKSQKINGVIINNDQIYKINKDHIKFFIANGLVFRDTIKWCENELNRIPPYLIDNKYQIINNFNSQDHYCESRVKRLGDIFLSIFLIIITLPISFLIIFCIFIEDQNPIFYSQIRTGFRGEKFRVYKFRSMGKDAEKYGPQWSRSGDQRITKVGGVIRLLRLDELPQLISVIEGKMSLIGPRPERPEIEEEFLKEIPFYKYRNLLKPGISGWAQVNYYYGENKQDAINKVSYDLFYMKNMSIFLDLQILLKTIKTVFKANIYKPKNE